MYNIRKAIQPILKSIHPLVFFETAPNDTDTPYLTYVIQVYPEGDRKLVVVEIDGWDIPNDGSTVELERLMQTVNDELDKKTIQTDEFVLTLFGDRQILVEEDDKRIKHRNFTYQGYMYERSE
ncbi:hypothetical protein [Fervidibacillus albus]|uniref:Uncharacterized protein n=1 Tax=Fervidibacillus albus TaxID=2980026 RepID=A0A9E8LWE2_9BACI|nr:hypothetical protein [Fervidibacillus albus]WAA10331.1 hypothetical protein OE104_03075 [Fervidibacillus albus]